MATGDPIFLRRADTSPIAGADRATLSGWLTDVWPAIDAANVDTLDVIRDFTVSGNRATAAARELRTVTPTVYASIDSTIEDGGLISVSGQDVVYYHIFEETVEGQLLIDLKNFIIDIFTEPGITTPSLRELMVKKDSNNDITGTLLYEVSDTPDNYIQLKLDGKANTRTGTEE